MITRKEVAKRAGVSEATVSRVFTNHPSVKKETKEKVLRVAEELGYTPNALAQSVARRRSMNIGVVVPYVPKVHIFSHDYFSEIISGIGEVAQEHGYDLVLFHRHLHQDMDYRRYYMNKKVDGTILLGTRMEEQEALADLYRHDLPFVLISNMLEMAPQYSILADHQRGSYEAMRHLVRLGHRRIAFLNGPDSYMDSIYRRKGVEQAREEWNLRGLLYFQGDFSRTSGLRFADLFVQLDPRPTAVFAANDRMAIGFMQGLKQHGVFPGLEVAIVGYDNSQIAQFSDPSLTTVHVPHFEMGKMAVEVLIRQLDEKKIHGPHILPTELIVRESSTQFEVDEKSL
ncbi:MAG: LacI family DNA-binding transcriptional regulator [Thermicanus sp.]|nr:LacI family DNA-binding transcriptional regulator [Thermicanus sp.]